MTEITFEQASPSGKRTVDTSRLFIRTDGEMYMRDSNGAMVVVSGEVKDALTKHFGRDKIAAASRAVKALK